MGHKSLLLKGSSEDVGRGCWQRTNKDEKPSLLQLEEKKNILKRDLTKHLGFVKLHFVC